MASVSLQDLRRRLYVKAKADKDWQFWGLYVHVAKPETLRAAYDLAKRNNRAPGIDGVTFGAIEAAGVEAFLGQLRDEVDLQKYGTRPCHRAVPATPSEGRTVSARGRSVLLPSPLPWRARPPRSLTCGATSVFACATAR